MNFLKTLFFLLAAATLCGSFPTVRERIRWAVGDYPDTLSRPFHSESPARDKPRILVRENLPAGEPLYLFIPQEEEGLTPFLRLLLIGLAWEVMPEKVVPFGETQKTNDVMNYVATSVWQGKCPAEGDYVSLDPGGDRPLWARQDALEVKSPACTGRKACAPVYELAGLFAPLLVMLGGVIAGGWLGLGLCLLAFSAGMGIPPLLGFAPSPLFVLGLAVVIVASGQWLVARLKSLRPCVFARGKFQFISRSQQKNPVNPLNPVNPVKKDFRFWRIDLICALALSLSLFALLAFIALSHTFTAPNGLGVFGGKAKLLYLAGGIPPDFFTDVSWEVLQPGYPPGFALVTLGCYGLAGGCGEWLTQLLPCAFCALACLLGLTAIGQGTRDWGLYALFAAAFLGSQPLWMASLYYAEPLMLLLLLVGVDAIMRKPDSVLGWVLVGGCGWIKNEGLLFLPLLWVALRWAEGKGRAPLRGLLLGLALPVGWLVWSRLHGGTLYDYAPLHQPDGGQIWKAVTETFRLAFLKPWQYGFAFPLACLVLFIPRFRTKVMLANILVLLGYTAAVWWIFGISRAPDFGWHLQSLGRLLWPPAMLFLFQLIHAIKQTRQEKICY